VKIIAISDTHSMHEQMSIPEGDILIHSGDITLYGRLNELQAFNDWLGTLPHKYKIIVAGNHDYAFESYPIEARSTITNGIYLQDEAVEIEGIKFYGSPWQPWHHNMAFNLERGPDLAEKWSMIPPDTDVLITHGPPYGQGDRTKFGLDVGCEDLLQRIEEIRPRLHIFGHIHEGAGITYKAGTAFINACSSDVGYKPTNIPIVFDLAAAQKQLELAIQY
jgi:Icc-related predicted phosphoesterase